MVDLTIHIPQVMYNQLVEYCNGIGEDIETFVFNLVADKLFTDIHGDLNSVLATPHEDNGTEGVVIVQTEEIVKTVENIKNIEKPVEQQSPIKEGEKETVDVTKSTTAEVVEKEKIDTNKTAVKRRTRTIKTK